jgi:hypothetical protein
MIAENWWYHAASAHGSLLASSHSEDPERPHLAVVCPLTTAACITQITLQPLSVGKSGACDDAALAHRSSFFKDLPNQGFFPTTNWGFDASGFSAQRAARAAWIVPRLLLRWTSSLSRPPGFSRDSHICRQYIPRDGKNEPGGTNWRSCLAF